MPYVHKHFTSTSAFADWCDSIGLGVKRDHDYWGERRYGYDDAMMRSRKGVQLLRDGDLTHVEDAKNLLRAFQESVEVPHYVWNPAVAGSFANVPAYLVGSPTSMWKREIELNTATPVRIWVGVTSTVVITDEQILKRGVALAAFAMALSAKRPAYITPYGNGHDYDRLYGRSGDEGSVVSWDIQTSPMVLSELMACLSNSLVTRHVTHPIARFLNPRVPAGVPFKDIRRQDMPAVQPQDVWLPPMIASDKLVSAPIAWIKEQLAKYSEETE